MPLTLKVSRHQGRVGWNLLCWLWAIVTLGFVVCEYIAKSYCIQLEWTSNTSRQKNNLPTNQKGYDKSETTDEKLSARRIQIYWVYFSLIIF